jgi:hypothetical protein
MTTADGTQITTRVSVSSECARCADRCASASVNSATICRRIRCGFLHLRGAAERTVAGRASCHASNGLRAQRLHTINEIPGNVVRLRRLLATRCNVAVNGAVTNLDEVCVDRCR